MSSVRYNPWRKHGIKMHRVLVDDPHPQSYAAQIKLRVQLVKEAMKAGDEFDYFRWVSIRAKWLGSQRKQHGTLKCFYCLRDNLKIETEDKPSLATIDHFIPISKGGKMQDENNFRVACHTCNQAKADTLPRRMGHE